MSQTRETNDEETATAKAVAALTWDRQQQQQQQQKPHQEQQKPHQEQQMLSDIPPSASKTTTDNNDTHHDSTNDSLMIQEMFAGYDSAVLDACIAREKDVLGTVAVPNCMQRTTAEREAARQGFEEALSMLPPDRRAAYDLARKRNPRIVALETPPERFLLFCDYNFWKSAEKLCEFWTQKRQIFGTDHFHLPLTVAPGVESALSPQVVECIRLSSMVVLPPDSYNRVVLIWDRCTMRTTQILGDDNVTNRLQIFFYMCHVASESPLAVSSGAVFIMMHEKDHVQPLEQPTQTQTQQNQEQIQEPRRSNNSKRKLNIPDGSALRLVLSEVIPLRFRSMHIVSFRQASLLHKFLAGLSVLSYQKEDADNFRLRAHECAQETAEAMLQAIQPFGLSRKHIPKRIGGDAVVDSSNTSCTSCESEEGENWFEKRQRIERERYSAIDSQKMGPTSTTAASEWLDEKKVAGKTSQDTTTTTKIGLEAMNQRKRKMDEFYQESVEQIHKRRITKLSQQNASFRKEQTSLLAHLTVAQQFANMTSEHGFTVTNQSDDDSGHCIRDKDPATSRPKGDCKGEEDTDDSVILLKDHVRALRAENEKLRKTEQRLRASLLVSKQFGNAFMRHKAQCKDDLAKAVSDLFASSLGASTIPYLTGSCQPQAVADRILSTVNWTDSNRTDSLLDVLIEDPSALGDHLRSMGYIWTLPSFKARMISLQESAGESCVGREAAGNKEETREATDDPRNLLGQSMVDPCPKPDLIQRKKSVKRRLSRKTNLGRL